MGLRAAPVQFALSVHSEDRYHPNTPDYVADPVAYRSARAALLDFAGRLAANNMQWNWQSDWNFLLAVKQFEVDQPDESLLAETGGTNIVRLLREGFGGEVDPHSHENDGYNFADVAYLISEVGVTPGGVVGGHVWDPADSGFQNWPRFATGLASSKFPGAYVWTPHLLTGEGTGAYEHDTAASGFWFPAGMNDYFSPALSGGAGGLWSLVTVRGLATQSARCDQTVAAGYAGTRRGQWRERSRLFGRNFGGGCVGFGELSPHRRHGRFRQFPGDDSGQPSAAGGRA